MEISWVPFNSGCKYSKRCKYSHFWIHLAAVYSRAVENSETHQWALRWDRLKQWPWLMAISVGMGECPASPYLSLSLLSIPFLLLPLLALPPHFAPSISLSSHTSSFCPPPHFLSARIFRPPFPFYHTNTNSHPPTSTSSSTPSHLLFLSERMFQTLHTDSSGILCVEMFLLDPQALTIYRTKASAPLLKAWHLWPPPPTHASDLSPWLIFPLPLSL